MPQLLPSLTVLYPIPKLPKGNAMKPVELSLTQQSAELIIRALIEMPFKQVNQLVHYIDHEIAVSQQQMPSNTVTVAPAQTYKYGLKKDGTPRKRPGRPLKK
jgi:hypothetical protein